MVCDCAKGTVENRIVMTKLPSSADELETEPSWPTDIRLVDESSVYFGRLQIMYREKWRGICANFQKYVILLLLLTVRGPVAYDIGRVFIN